MWRQISWLNLIVVLFGSTAALQSSSNTNLAKPKQARTIEELVVEHPDPKARSEQKEEKQEREQAQHAKAKTSEKKRSAHVIEELLVKHPDPKARIERKKEKREGDHAQYVKATHVSQGSDDERSLSKIPANKMESKAGEYHRAVDVPRGQCTKKLKPNLLFIGQAYSGTTSLAAQMQLHPELSFGDTKEHKHFKPDYTKINSDESWENYLETFWVHCNTSVAFDATPSYILVAEGTKSVPGEQSVRYIHQRFGNDVKIMMMFRDPVDLMFSRQCRGDGGPKKRPFTVDEPYNVTAGDRTKFAALLSIWQKVFTNKNNWLFLSSDEYFANPEKVLKKVYDFAGVSPLKPSKENDAVSQNGRRRCTFKATPAERKAYWSVKDNLEDKHSLEKLTGLKFFWQKGWAK